MISFILFYALILIANCTICFSQYMSFSCRNTYISAIMYTLSPSLVAYTILVVWPTVLATAKIHHPSSRVYNIANRNRNFAGRNDNNSCSSTRKLSAEEQLDILRLGFIPCPSDNDGGDCKRRNILRGGGSLDNGTSSKNRHLSVDEQRDILKLGFISPTGDSRDDKVQGLMRFIPRGGSIDAPVKQRQKCTTISGEDQLNIIKLGFIPPSSPTSHTIYYASKPLDILRTHIIPSLSKQKEKDGR